MAPAQQDPTPDRAALELELVGRRLLKQQQQVRWDTLAMRPENVARDWVDVLRTEMATNEVRIAEVERQLAVSEQTGTTESTSDDSAPPLTPNEQEWRGTITRTVTTYRADHQGQSPSVRIFAQIAEGTTDPRAYRRWRGRIKEHPRIVDPALKWPQGELMARGPKRPA